MLRYVNQKVHVQKPYYCPKCERTFSHLFDLTKRYKTHTLEYVACLAEFDWLPHMNSESYGSATQLPVLESYLNYMKSEQDESITPSKVSKCKLEYMKHEPDKSINQPKMSESHLDYIKCEPDTNSWVNLFNVKHEPDGNIN